jgi:hypothetical protein
MPLKSWASLNYNAIFDPFALEIAMSILDRPRRAPADHGLQHTIRDLSPAAPRRRGDRITRGVANGPTRTSRHVRLPAAVGGKADIGQQMQAS